VILVPSRCGSEGSPGLVLTNGSGEPGAIRRHTGACEDGDDTNDHSDVHCVADNEDGEP
jgi:hypothetical protein